MSACMAGSEEKGLGLSIRSRLSQGYAYMQRRRKEFSGWGSFKCYFSKRFFCALISSLTLYIQEMYNICSPKKGAPPYTSIHFRIKHVPIYSHKSHDIMEVTTSSVIVYVSCFILSLPVDLGENECLPNG